MVNKIDKKTRSKIMSAIRSKDTKPELIVRKGLFKRGYRYRLHHKSLAGKPDIVLSKYRAAIFVNGCFWHGHDCFLFQKPSTNISYWEKKITDNRARDIKSVETLISDNWRVLVIWECALYRKSSKDISRVLDRAEKWLLSNRKKLEIVAVR